MGASGAEGGGPSHYYPSPTIREKLTSDLTTAGTQSLKALVGAEAMQRMMSAAIAGAKQEG
jgi:hypothetical protein